MLTIEHDGEEYLVDEGTPGISMSGEWGVLLHGQRLINLLNASNNDAAIAQAVSAISTRLEQLADEASEEATRLLHMVEHNLSKVYEQESKSSNLRAAARKWRGLLK